MGAEIVHNDNVALFEIGHELLFYKGKKDLNARSCIDGHEAPKTVQRDRADHCDCFPLAADDLARCIISSGSPTVTRWGAEPKSRLVEKDEPACVQLLLFLGEFRSLFTDVRAVSFAGDRCLFLYVQPIARIETDIVCLLTRTPLSCSQA